MIIGQRWLKLSDTFRPTVLLLIPTHWLNQFGRLVVKDAMLVIPMSLPSVNYLLTRSSMELNLKLPLFHLFVERLNEIKGAMLNAIHNNVGQIVEDLMKKKDSVPKLYIETLDDWVFQQRPDWDPFWMHQMKVITSAVSSMDSPSGRI